MISIYNLNGSLRENSTKIVDCSELASNNPLTFIYILQLLSSNRLAY